MALISLTHSLLIRRKISNPGNRYKTSRLLEVGRNPPLRSPDTTNVIQISTKTSSLTHSTEDCNAYSLIRSPSILPYWFISDKPVSGVSAAFSIFSSDKKSYPAPEGHFFFADAAAFLHWQLQTNFYVPHLQLFRLRTLRSSCPAQSLAFQLIAIEGFFYTTAWLAC